MVFYGDYLFIYFLSLAARILGFRIKGLSTYFWALRIFTPIAESTGVSDPFHNPLRK